MNTPNANVGNQTDHQQDSGTPAPETGEQNANGQPATPVEEVAAEARAEKKTQVSRLELISKETSGTMTHEATRWIRNRNAIPGAGFAPIRFVGQRNIEEFSKLLGRPMELAEVQLLVQADGPTRVCPIFLKELADAGEENAETQATFQPVRYCYMVPQAGEQQIAQNKSLEGVALPYGGAYYQNDKMFEGEPFAISGCVYNSTGRYAAGSPLVIMASTLMKLRRSHSPLWGEALTDITERMAARQRGKQTLKHRHDIIDQMADAMSQVRNDRRQHRQRGLGRVNDAFELKPATAARSNGS